jgi:hypothetical protein
VPGTYDVLIDGVRSPTSSSRLPACPGCPACRPPSTWPAPRSSWSRWWPASRGSSARWTPTSPPPASASTTCSSTARRRWACSP